MQHGPPGDLTVNIAVIHDPFCRSKSANPLDFPKKSTIRAIFKAKRIHPPHIGAS